MGKRPGLSAVTPMQFGAGLASRLTPTVSFADSGGMAYLMPLNDQTDAVAPRPLRGGQFSLGCVLGAMAVVGAVLTIGRHSVAASLVFTAIVVPALCRSVWAENLSRRAGIRREWGDAIGVYFVSLMVVLVCAGFSLVAGSGMFLWSAMGLDPQSGAPRVLAAVVSTITFAWLLWLSRPRLAHYVP